MNSEYPPGHYSVRVLGKPGRVRLLCSACAEKRHVPGVSVRPVDIARPTDQHTDCADCGAECVEPELSL